MLSTVKNGNTNISNHPYRTVVASFLPYFLTKGTASKVLSALKMNIPSREEYKDGESKEERRTYLADKMFGTSCVDLWYIINYPVIQWKVDDEEQIKWQYLAPAYIELRDRLNRFYRVEATVETRPRHIAWPRRGNRLWSKFELVQSPDLKGVVDKLYAELLDVGGPGFSVHVWLEHTVRYFERQFPVLSEQERNDMGNSIMYLIRKHKSDFIDDYGRGIDKQYAASGKKYTKTLFKGKPEIHHAACLVTGLKMEYVLGAYAVDHLGIAAGSLLELLSSQVGGVQDWKTFVQTKFVTGGGSILSPLSSVMTKLNLLVEIEKYNVLVRQYRRLRRTIAFYRQERSEVIKLYSKIRKDLLAIDRHDWINKGTFFFGRLHDVELVRLEEPIPGVFLRHAKVLYDEIHERVLAFNVDRIEKAKSSDVLAALEVAVGVKRGEDFAMLGGLQIDEGRSFRYFTRPGFTGTTEQQKIDLINMAKVSGDAAGDVQYLLRFVQGKFRQNKYLHDCFPGGFDQHRKEKEEEKEKEVDADDDSGIFYLSDTE